MEKNVELLYPIGVYAGTIIRIDPCIPCKAAVRS